MNKAFLLIGGNTGRRQDYLGKARNGIEDICGKILQASPVYETAAWGLEDQPSFLNQVLEIETGLKAPGLLRNVLSLEETLGRRREAKYGPRVIDIDILFFNNEAINTEGLTVPHPQMPYRRFVLVPLNDIAPQKLHPLLKKSVAQLLDECPDHLPVQKFR